MGEILTGKPVLSDLRSKSHIQKHNLNHSQRQIALFLTQAHQTRPV